MQFVGRHCRIFVLYVTVLLLDVMDFQFMWALLCMKFSFVKKTALHIRFNYFINFNVGMFRSDVNQIDFGCQFSFSTIIYR